MLLGFHLPATGSPVSLPTATRAWAPPERGARDRCGTHRRPAGQQTGVPGRLGERPRPAGNRRILDVATGVLTSPPPTGIDALTLGWVTGTAQYLLALGRSSLHGVGDDRCHQLMNGCCGRRARVAVCEQQMPATDQGEGQ